MNLGDMPIHDIDLGSLVLPDKNYFRITARLYETPPYYDYWLTTYDGEHSGWGHMRMQGIIPKRIAPTLDLARTYTSGPIADQVRSTLMGATAEGRPLGVVFSPDGWTLI